MRLHVIAGCSCEYTLMRAMCRARAVNSCLHAVSGKLLTFSTFTLYILLGSFDEIFLILEDNFIPVTVSHRDIFKISGLI